MTALTHKSADEVRKALEAEGLDVRHACYARAVIWDDESGDDDDDGNSTGALIIVDQDGDMMDGPYDDLASAIEDCELYSTDRETEDLQEAIADAVYDVTDLAKLRAAMALLQK